MLSKPFHEMTLAELETERAHWDSKIRSASGWGALVTATRFRADCDLWISRRKLERSVKSEASDLERASMTDNREVDHKPLVIQTKLAHGKTASLHSGTSE